MKDLADYINSQTGWSAAVTSTRLSSSAPSALDKGAFEASSSIVAQPARIKRDASEWARIVGGCTLARPMAAAAAGLPEASTSDQFLSGGAKGGTTSADATAAIDQLDRLATNFIVALFSRDAADDLAEGLTESSSTYSVDAINAYMKSHVNRMSQIKMRKFRSAVLSKRASYADIKEAAGDIAAFRCGFAFSDFKTVAGDGTIRQFQPWMSAVNAAAMQLAAGYRGIVKKFSNCSGAVYPTDFDPTNPSQTEDALKAGLLVLEPVTTGGWRWLSDQTTYSVDNNFVYNSLQAVYIADLITYDLNEKFDRAVAGQSVADITAGGALGVLAGACFEYKRLRWIAASDDAPDAYRNARAKLKGGVMEVYCEIKLAGLIYFIPIYLTISQVQQEAAQ
jgi:hypothetical protein